MTNSLNRIFDDIAGIGISLECDDGFLIDMGLNWCHGRALDQMRADFPDVAAAFERMADDYGRPAMFTAFELRERELFGVNA